MCILIVKEKKDLEISNEVLTVSSIINPHGLGIIWLDTFELEYHNSTDYQLLQVDRPFIAHFRYATVGGSTPENRHPFNITDEEYLFQNGTNYNLGYNGSTDTEHLADILSSCSKYVWRDILEMTDSRYVTANVHEKTYEIYNESMWYRRNGVLFSKNNILDKTLVAVYGTLRKGCHNYETFLADSLYIGNGETNNRYPLIIQDLPYVMDKPNKGFNIVVDIFAVDKETLSHLDRLEGHPNWYVRKKVDVSLSDGSILKTWLYFNDTIEDSGEYHKGYLESNEVGKNDWSYDDFDSVDIERYNDLNNYNHSCEKCKSYDTIWDGSEDDFYCFNCMDYCL